MNKASSALLATAGVTAGLLSFALPAGAAVSDGSPGPAAQTQPQTPANAGVQDPSGTYNRSPGAKKTDDPSRGRPDSGRGDKRNPCPTRTGKPCPPRTHKPCPPKPCQPVSKPGPSHKDKHGHLTSYRSAPKHVLVCKPKPCPAKAKPCPPKCKKTGHHKHPCPPKRVN